MTDTYQHRGTFKNFLRENRLIVVPETLMTRIKYGTTSIPPDPNKAVATPDTYRTTLGSIRINWKSPKSTLEGKSNMRGFTQQATFERNELKNKKQKVPRMRWDVFSSMLYAPQLYPFQEPTRDHIRKWITKFQKPNSHNSIYSWSVQPRR